ncbi:MAG: FecR domain-containing protein [Halioglobus sp.]
MRSAFLLALLLLAPSLAAAEQAGTIKTSQGAAYILRTGLKLPANPGERVNVSDSIVTGSDGTVGITLLDDTRLTAGPDSNMELRRFVFDSTTHAGGLDAKVKRGSLAVISGKIAKTNPENVSFSTSTVTLGVRGTRFIIKADN